MKSLKLPVIVAGLILAIGIASSIMYEPEIKPIAPPSPLGMDANLRHAGARVVALGDCVVCHTAPGGRPFAGGLPLATPFGTIYATNITPDEETGIGTWSLEAFMRAMRSGVSRDGHLLYPAFPYVHFTHMSDRDIAAAYTYLMSQEAVHLKTPENDLLLPLRFRPFVAFWNILYLRQGPEQVERLSHSPMLSRGEYLVNGPGHCASCHTPLNLIGGEKTRHTFEGSVVDGWEAPALNALKDAPTPWTQSQLVTYLRTGVSSAHGAAAGPMLPVVRELATVPLEDVEAIAAYILSQGGPSHPKPAAQRPTLNASSPDIKASELRGRIIFDGACAQCHDEKSPMREIGNRPSLSTSSAINAATPRNTVQMILNGIKWNREERATYMPDFSGVFDEQQIADLATYLRSEYSTQGPWSNPKDISAQLLQEHAKK